MGGTGRPGNRSSRPKRHKGGAKRKPRGREAEGWKNLIPVKAGEIRNPKGINGWTAARERVREVLAANADQLVDKLVETALSGNRRDIIALRFALGPLVPMITQRIEAEHQGAVVFRWEDECDPEREVI